MHAIVRVCMAILKHLAPIDYHYVAILICALPSGNHYYLSISQLKMHTGVLEHA
jgi:hypothetical protein